MRTCEVRGGGDSLSHSRLLACQDLGNAVLRGAPFSGLLGANGIGKEEGEGMVLPTLPPPSLVRPSVPPSPSPSQLKSQPGKSAAAAAGVGWWVAGAAGGGGGDWWGSVTNIVKGKKFRCEVVVVAGGGADRIESEEAEEVVPMACAP